MVIQKRVVWRLSVICTVEPTAKGRRAERVRVFDRATAYNDVHAYRSTSTKEPEGRNGER